MKKMKRAYIFVILFLLSSNLMAQDETCGTEPLPDSLAQSMPWFGNNDFLYDLLDSLGYSTPANASFKRVKPYDIPLARYRVPVKFWFYQGKYICTIVAFSNEINNRSYRKGVQDEK